MIRLLCGVCGNNGLYLLVGIVINWFLLMVGFSLVVGLVVLVLCVVGGVGVLLFVLMELGWFWLLGGVVIILCSLVWWGWWGLCWRGLLGFGLLCWIVFLCVYLYFSGLVWWLMEN